MMSPLLWLRQPRHPYQTLPTYGCTGLRLISEDYYDDE